MLCQDGEHAGVPACGDIVDDIRPGLQGRPRHLGLGGIHGEGDGGEFPDGADDGQDAAEFLFGGDAMESGAGGFAAHVQDIRPFRQEPFRLG